MFGDGDKLTLSIPESENAMWSAVDGTTELKHVPLSDVNDVKFLIFQPSTGRARHALLDLSDAMAPDGKYTQVVVVKQKDEAEYRQCWPARTLLVLPASADALGVGASRYWIQHFSSAVMDPAFPFIFVLDDSVLYWKRTLNSLPVVVFRTLARGVRHTYIDSLPRLPLIALLYPSLTGGCVCGQCT
jgi:hypothetical protein